MENQPAAFALTPKSLDEALRFAEILSKSSIVPKDFAGNPGNILVAIQWGLELGLQPMQAMQNIAVINGRPSLWGDAVLAMVLASPVCDDVIEYYEGDANTEGYTAVCIAKRKGRQDKTSRFSLADAKRAGLLNKQGPWTQYRDRMMKMRARAFALRDQFTDVLKGMAIAEEVMDIDPGAVVIEPAQQPAVQPMAIEHNGYSQERFDRNIAAWTDSILNKGKTAEEVIQFIESRGEQMSEGQKKQIRSIKQEQQA